MSGHLPALVFPLLPALVASKVEVMKNGFSYSRTCALFAVWFLVGLTPLLAHCSPVMDDKISNRLTFEQIREKVTLALPRGTPLAEIEQYFKRNDVEVILTGP